MLSGREELLESVCGDELADAMLEQDLCQIAVRCQLVIDSLHGRKVPSAKESTLESTSQRWKFDYQLANERDREQRWDAAREHCIAVTESAPHLAWAWDVAGYALDRSGQRDHAIQLYRRGIQCSAFTDQCVRVGTHAFTGGARKFAALRLSELGYESDDPQERQYLEHLNLRQAEECRRAVYAHHATQAEAAGKAGDAAAAYLSWYRGGWDVGAEPLKRFATVLSMVAVSAEDAGYGAVAALAKCHAHCFDQRYGKE